MTYHDAEGEDGGELGGVGFVAVVEQDLLFDPFVVHRVENGHSDPEPDVERGQSATQKAALFEAAHARC